MQIKHDSDWMSSTVELIKCLEDIDKTKINDEMGLFYQFFVSVSDGDLCYARAFAVGTNYYISLILLVRYPRADNSHKKSCNSGLMRANK
jgi:hypothetical protein